MLAMKLPTWQEKCSDITKVPDTVATMIEELSVTPEQSPLVERCNRVCFRWSLWICADTRVGIKTVSSVRFLKNKKKVSFSRETCHF